MTAVNSAREKERENIFLIIYFYKYFDKIDFFVLSEG